MNLTVGILRAIIANLSDEVEVCATINGYEEDIDAHYLNYEKGYLAFEVTTDDESEDEDEDPWLNDSDPLDCTGTSCDLPSDFNAKVIRDL
jgi:hypothetical protein